MASTKRFGERGHCDSRALPRGPNGRALCRQCQQEVPKGKRTFCSEPCIEQWKLRTDPATQAEFILKRDQGICAICLIDCVKLRHQLIELRIKCRAEQFAHLVQGYPTMKSAGEFSLDRKLEKFAAVCDTLELPQNLRRLTRRLWEIDHTVPVIEGGGDCGPENLRTLCWRCHRTETRKLRARLAAARRGRSSDPTETPQP